MRAGRWAWLALALSALPAHAMTAAEVFAQVSPSVWTVITYDEDGLRLASGSAVVVGPQRLVTNCHVLARAKRVTVRREKVVLEARLDQWDVQRDVCQVRASGLDAPPVSFGDAAALAVGQPVFAIGSPRGLELTISAGLLSALRHNSAGQLVLLQTSAAVSPGSSGGGLFDDRGTLIGLITLGSNGNAQNLNFAVPVEWVRELPQRHAQARAAAAAGSAAAEPAAK